MIRRTLATLLVTAPAPIALLAGPAATAANAPVTEPSAAESATTEQAPAPADSPPPASPPAEPAPAPPPAQEPAAAPAPTSTTPADPQLGEATPKGTRRPRPQRTTGDARLEKRPAGERAPQQPAPSPAGGAAAADGDEDGGAEAPRGALSPLGPVSPGVPNFFIESFRIPPFLLPIYQAAGVQYGIRWEILAAINEIETDYGRNLAVSSAGALGWMQFMPATWRAYGVDANLDGEKDPFNPVDAIFAAARYLRAAGADDDLQRAIFAYNRADWYVRDVLRRAKLIAALPSDLVSSLTGLTQGIFPVGSTAGDRGATGRLGPKLEDGRQLRIRAKSGAVATAVTDGTVVGMGSSERLGRYVRLRDAYGNVYTYGGLRSFATEIPVPRPKSTTREEIRVELDLPKRGSAPRLAASTTDEPAQTAPLATATPPRPDDVAGSPSVGGAEGAADTTGEAPQVRAAATTVVVAPPPRTPVRPPLPSAPDSSVASLDPPAGGTPASGPVALPGVASPVASTPAPEPQIDSPAAAPPQPVPVPEVPTATAPETPTTPSPEVEPPAPAAPSTGEPPGAATTPAAAGEPVRTAPAAPPDDAPATTTPTMPTPTTTTPATDPEPAPGEDPAEPGAGEDPPTEEAGRSESEARAEADPVLDPLLPERQIEMPAPPAGEPESGSAPPAGTPDATPEKTAEPAARSATAAQLDRSFTVDYGLKPQDVTYVPLRKGRRVIAGTVLGALGRGASTEDDELAFEVRPAGKDTPRIDPRPIVRGWRLLESTALYRARAADVGSGSAATIGQILLMDKQTLQRRVLANDRIDLYSCGRRDIASGIIDRRVLAALEFLAASDLRPTVTSLRCGHGVYTASGNVSHHTTGSAVDIAAINGIPIVGNQGRGSITDRAVRKLLTLQGTMRPAQIITLMKYEGVDNTLAMADHHDHIHIGWRPGYEPRSETGRELESLLKPDQWAKLVRRLNTIENPKIPSAPSKYALKAERRADRLRGAGAGGAD